jgi:hypothetical protein
MSELKRKKEVSWKSQRRKNDRERIRYVRLIIKRNIKNRSKKWK